MTSPSSAEARLAPTKSAATSDPLPLISPECLHCMGLLPEGPQSPELSLDLLSLGEVLDSLSDGVYITDRDRLIIFWNRAAEEITGWKREQVVGKHCRDNILVHVDKDGRRLCGRELCPLHRAIVTERRSASPLLVFAQRSDGSRVAVEASVAPLRDAEGQIIGGIEVFRDVSEGMDDMKRAQLIQRSTMDSKLPSDPRLAFATHYIPYDLIGGDFFRIEALDADRYAVFIGDVTGHGLAAALYTMQIRSQWEENRADLGDPQRFMAALNRRLHMLSRPNDYFATGIHAVINAATGEGTYVRAGHEPALLRRADGQVQALEQRGLGLGLLPEATYRADNFTLNAGDGLLLYTDGAVEIRSRGGEELGTAGLSFLLRDPSAGTPRFLARLEEALLTFSAAIRLEDDLTLLWVQRRS